MKGALPLSKAGERSTSFGIMPLFRRLNIPSEMSSSVIGGGSAKGSSLKFFGRMRFGCDTFFPLSAPIPSLSSSFMLIAP